METTGLKITRREAIDALVTLFKCEKWVEGEDRPKLSFYIPKDDDSAEFYIHKQEFERGEVVNVLANYFQDKTFNDGGMCAVSPITLLWTTFTIERIPAPAAKEEEDEQ